MTTPIIIQIVMLVVAGLVAYFGFVTRITNRVSVMESRCEQHVSILLRVEAMNSDLQTVKAENKMFWTVLEPHLGKIIHSPVHKTRDELVDRFIEGRLTMDEAPVLECELRNALANDDWPSEKRLAAALLLGRLLSIQHRCDP
jgi:hypothetical protein